VPEGKVEAAWAFSTSTPPPMTLAVPMITAAFLAFCRNPLRLDGDGPADQAMALEESIPKHRIDFADDFMIIVNSLQISLMNLSWYFLYVYVPTQWSIQYINRKSIENPNSLTVSKS
jgi:hypothetical protein